MDCWEFTREVGKHIPRATKAERSAIRRELQDHVMDAALMLEEGGCSPEDSVERAVARMGDPAEIGQALNAQLSPFWLWLDRVSRALAVLVCLLLVLNAPLLEYRFREIVQVRRGTEEDWRANPVHLEVLADRGYTLIWDVDIRGSIGDDVVRVSQVYLDPTPGWGKAGAWVVVYPKNPFGVAPSIPFREIKMFSQTGGGNGGSFAAQTTSDIFCSGEILDVPVALSDKYMTLRWERFGEILELPIPLDWEVEP